MSASAALLLRILLPVGVSSASSTLHPSTELQHPTGSDAEYLKWPETLCRPLPNDTADTLFCSTQVLCESRTQSFQHHAS
eukprot:650131-Amphidinium_carterae.1